MPYFPEKKPDPPGKEKQPEEEKQAEGMTEKQIKLFRLCLAVFSCLLIVWGAVRLIGYGADLSASRQTSRELQQLHEQEVPEEKTEAPAEPEPTGTQAPTDSPVPTDSPAPAETPRAAEDDPVLQPVTYPDNPGLKVSARFRQLRKKSGYIIGWLSMDGVEEAVALKDNSFFLDHDATGKKNTNGAIFLDAGIGLLTRPYTVILYGHNMKSGNMFGRLKKYLEYTYCAGHRTVSFDSLYEEGKYAVFAVAQISTEPGTATYYDLWALTSNDRAYREKAIEKLKNRSVHPDMLDVQADEQILLLVTCIDTDTDRLIVAARRLREGETEEKLDYKQK